MGRLLDDEFTSHGVNHRGLLVDGVTYCIFRVCIVGGEIMELTKAQTYVSDFLYNIYLESDSKDLDEWLIYLARENGDEQLAKMMGDNK
jgi:hypothetical protein